MLLYIGITLVMGAVTEAAAHGLALWRYRIGWVRVFNIVVTFGLIYGLLSYWLADAGFPVQFAVGAVLGLINEIANDVAFRAWYFPGHPRWLKGRPAVIGIGLGWGLVPPIAVALRDLLP